MTQQREVYPQNPPEMEKLLMKYRSGNVPPLVIGGNGKDEGLLSEELLEIFRKGFSATYAIPLCFLPFPRTRRPEIRISAISEKDLSHQKLNNLLTLCKYLQSPQTSDTKENMRQGEELPDCYCFAKHVLAAQNGGLYMCDVGMISLFMPIHVAGEIVAVLSTECKKPKAGAIWPDGFVQQNDVGSPTARKKKESEELATGDWRLTLETRRHGDTETRRQSPHRRVAASPRPSGNDQRSSSSATRIDLWQESRRRIQECEETLGLESGQLLIRLTESVKMDPKIEASPEDLETIMTGLENAGKHLSDLADKAYRLEKESVIGWIRAEMASALSSASTFWDGIRRCLENLAQLLGADYILLISQDKSHASHSDSFHLQCQYGLPQESLPALQYDWAGSTAHVDDFVKTVGALGNIQEIDLRQYRDVPILGELYSLYGKGVDYPILVVPTTTLDGKLTCLILGKRETTFAARRGTIDQTESGRSDTNSNRSRSPSMKWLKEDDRQHLMTVVRELTIITNVFFSMRKLQETVEAQTDFMESVAHDLRTPIQNIMIATENLREGRIAPERASRTIVGVVTQLQRLNLLAQKAWMLEQIRLDTLIYNDEQMVSPYLIFTECREILTDMAERIPIDIHVDPGIKRWRAIHIDAEMFRLVVLNLLHNGVKYSFPNTHIRIGGWQDGVGIGVAMTFENEGVPIHDEEKDRIFERYFRSKDAVKMDPAGSGIGLALVREFVDHYRGRIDVRSTEVGFGRYLNVFSLFLPGR